MSSSSYIRTKTLDFWYGKRFSAAPATLYVQLHTASPGAAGTSNVHSGFPRIAVPNDSSHWTAASAGATSNSLKIDYGDTTGQSTLADATHVTIWDSLTGGNLLDQGAFNSPLVTADRVEVSILAGDLDITRT